VIGGVNGRQRLLPLQRPTKGRTSERRARWILLRWFAVHGCARWPRHTRPIRTRLFWTVTSGARRALRAASSRELLWGFTIDQRARCMLHRRGVYEHCRRAISHALLFRPRRAPGLLARPSFAVIIVYGTLLRCRRRRPRTKEPPNACDTACQNLRWPLPNMDKLQPRPRSLLQLRLFRLWQAKRLPRVMRTPTIEVLQRVSVLGLPPRAVECLRDPAEVEQSA